MKALRDRLVIPAAAVLLLGISSTGFAQSRLVGARAAEQVPEQAAVPDPAPEWGTTTQLIHKVSVTDFRRGAGYELTVSLAGPSIQFFQSSPAVQTGWWAQAKLPSGAIIESVELDACDTSATGQIFWDLWRTTAGGTGVSSVTLSPGTGLAATPGCTFFSVAPSSPPLVVDNNAFNYWVALTWAGDFTSALTVAGVRIRYRLQVSPAPGVATFPNDVPTSHPFFRYVEALAAAGITGGCGTQRYCPDQAVTRGQMAVFLSVALGLHWPN